MNYRIREGIVYTSICGIPLLIATRKAWDICPPVMELSALKSTFWKAIQKDMNEDEFIEVLRMPPRMKEETVRKLFRKFISEMTDKGYLIQETDDA